MKLRDSGKADPNRLASQAAQQCFPSDCSSVRLVNPDIFELLLMVLSIYLLE